MMGHFVLLLITIIALYAGASIQSCCFSKTVGGVAFLWLRDGDTKAYGCKDECIYERFDKPGSNFCFKGGAMEVVCKDQDRDFSYHEGKLTFDEANTECQKMGKYLASIHSEQENMFVASLIPSLKQVWIGGYDYAEEDVFKWTDSSKFNYNNFFASQPNGKESENCLMIKSSTFVPQCWASTWFDRSCEIKGNYMCAKKAEGISNRKSFKSRNSRSATEDIIAENGLTRIVRAGKTLSFHPELKTFKEARAVCQAENGDLASIHSYEENDMIAQIIPSSAAGAWIGGTDEILEENWVWTDGSEWNYNNWVTDQPNGGHTENCATVYSANAICMASGWTDRPCDLSYAFVCENS